MRFPWCIGLSVNDSSQSKTEKLCLVCGGHFTAANLCPKDGTSLVPINQDAQTGDLFGTNYEVLDTIGRGGMSVVYKAKHKVMKRVVALKVLTANDPYSVKRFQLEARLASNLQHENIVTVYEFGQAEDSRPYIAMAFIEGQTLSSVIATEGAMEYKRALKLFIQACDALAYAHSCGVIHRDLKPGNFMLVRTKKGEEQIKLLDFGIAKQLDPADDIQQLTASGQVFGSPLYMSPEQCLGHKLDARADIYSIGCVMYEVLSGLPPFVGKSPLDTMQMHVQKDAKPFNQISTKLEVPRQFEHIVLKALDRDLASRYQTVDVLVNELNFFRIQLKAMENTMVVGLATADFPSPPSLEPAQTEPKGPAPGPKMKSEPAAESASKPRFDPATNPFAVSPSLSQSFSASPPPSPELDSSGHFDASPEAAPKNNSRSMPIADSASFPKRFAEPEMPSASAAMRQLLGETEPPWNPDFQTDLLNAADDSAPSAISPTGSHSDLLNSLASRNSPFTGADMAVSDYAPDSATVIASASINTSDSVKHKVDLAPENTAFAKQKAFKPPSPSAPPAPRINGRVLAVVLVVLALLAAIFGFVLIGHH